MIKTFKRGNQERLKRWKVFQCNTCGWIGAADKDSYEYSTQYNEEHYYLNCPCCNHTSAYEVEDEALKEQVLREVLFK